MVRQTGKSGSSTLSVGELGDPQFIPILTQLLEHFDDSDGLIRSSLDRLKAAQSSAQTPA